jgi:hypothetical protein
LIQIIAIPSPYLPTFHWKFCLIFLDLNPSKPFIESYSRNLRLSLHRDVSQKNFSSGLPNYMKEAGLSKFLAGCFQIRHMAPERRATILVAIFVAGKMPALRSAINRKTAHESALFL